MTIIIIDFECFDFIFVVGGLVFTIIVAIVINVIVDIRFYFGWLRLWSCWFGKCDMKIICGNRFERMNYYFNIVVVIIVIIIIGIVIRKMKIIIGSSCGCFFGRIFIRFWDCLCYYLKVFFHCYLLIFCDSIFFFIYLGIKPFFIIKIR